MKNPLILLLAVGVLISSPVISHAEDAANQHKAGHMKHKMQHKARNEYREDMRGDRREIKEDMRNEYHNRRDELRDEHKEKRDTAKSAISNMKAKHREELQALKKRFHGELKELKMRHKAEMKKIMDSHRNKHSSQGEHDNYSYMDGDSGNVRKNKLVERRGLHKERMEGRMEKREEFHGRRRSRPDMDE